jgi:hypothetical protein
LGFFQGFSVQCLYQFKTATKFSASLAPKRFGMAMNRLHQGRNVFWRRKLANAMTQVKDVRGACAVGIGMWLAKTVQDPNDFFLNLGGGRKQNIGVNIALQGFARAIHSTAHHLASTS